MFTKTTIALSALLIVGATATAFAYEDPENKIGDRYPSLEQRYAPVTTNNVAAKRVTVSKFDRHANEDSENKIGDRYPLLEQTYASVSTSNVGMARMAAPQAAKLDQYANEVPENKIGDRYPFLEQPIQFANVGSKATASARRPANSVKISGAKLSDRQTARNSY